MAHRETPQTGAQSPSEIHECLHPSSQGAGGEGMGATLCVRK